MSGKLIISLDFELHWGVFDTVDESYNINLNGARDSIPLILGLFKKYKISATWATVGLLFNKSKEDYENFLPRIRNSNDTFNNPYKVKVGLNEEDDPFHYAYSLINEIKHTPNQEIGSHSYSHFNCSEEFTDIEAFESDLISAKRVAEKNFNVVLKSYVFPKNQINKSYFRILKKHSINIYRGSNYISRHNNIFFRFLRLLDSYFSILPSSYGTEVYLGLVCTIGSRFLRPYKNSFLNYFMLRRIVKEMRFAARNNLIYHLWWHPHNFGSNAKLNLRNLEILLKEYKQLKKEFNFQSVSMEEIC